MYTIKSEILKNDNIEYRYCILCIVCIFKYYYCDDQFFIFKYHEGSSNHSEYISVSASTYFIL